MKSMTTVGEQMTPMPHSVGLEQTLATARSLMLRHHVRHLPVLHAGRLVGILSSRDIDYLSALRDIDPERVTVEEAMSQAPYTVAPSTPLDEVALTMARERYGCALVTEHDKVVGIFTTVDGMRLLGESLRRLAANAKAPVAARTTRDRRSP
jgi:acetoin utilization protein AcuB